VKPTFFATPAAFRAWLRKHHKSEKELIVGFYKKATGKPSGLSPRSRKRHACAGWRSWSPPPRKAGGYSRCLVPRASCLVPGCLVPGAGCYGCYGFRGFLGLYGGSGGSGVDSR